MLSSTIFTGLLGASFALAAPISLLPRVTIDKAATAEAHQRDDTATRAFSGAPIKTSGGKCLSIDPESGDFRQNLIPIQVQDCNGSQNQQWDVITTGKHNDQAGRALIVSSLTQGCLNFDPRRADGNQVILFSCGGRAAGEGLVTDFQLFPFDGKASNIALAPKNSQDKVCLTVKGDKLDQGDCDLNAPGQDQLFAIGGGESSPDTQSQSQSQSQTQPTLTSVVQSSSIPATSTSSGVKTTGTVKHDDAAVKEAHQRDETATREFSDVQVKTSDGQCLSIDPLAGDFRQNLIPVSVQACDNSPNQKFDVISKGKHNDQDGAILIVSTLTQGCLNVDPRRSAGNQVLLFSCGGRADGEGLVTDSQLFDFTREPNHGLIPLVPLNAKDKCLTTQNGALDIAECSQAQTFSFAA